VEAGQCHELELVADRVQFTLEIGDPLVGQVALPVERRRAVAGQQLAGELGMDALGELPGPTRMFQRRPASVRVPSGTRSRSSAVTATSSCMRSIWFGWEMTSSKTARAMGTSPGWATQVPSWPSVASRLLVGAETGGHPETPPAGLR
jgi:hypothetical protein